MRKSLLHTNTGRHFDQEDSESNFNVYTINRDQDDDCDRELNDEEKDIL